MHTCNLMNRFRDMQLSPKSGPELVDVDPLPVAPCGEHQQGLPRLGPVRVPRDNAQVDRHVVVTEVHRLKAREGGITTTRASFSKVQMAQRRIYGGHAGMYILLCGTNVIHEAVATGRCEAGWS